MKSKLKANKLSEKDLRKIKGGGAPDWWYLVSPALDTIGGMVKAAKKDKKF